MGKRRQYVRLVGLALALALVAAACGGGGNKSSSGGQSAAPEKGGVLRTGISDFGFTNGFDPTGEYVAVAIGLYGAMERTLMGYKHVAGPPGNHQQQRHGGIRGGVSEHPRRIRHHDPGLGGGLDVDVVVTDAEIAQEPGPQLTVEQFGRQSIRHGGQHHIGALQCSAQPVAT